jgi:Uma2 family endonuclease
MSPEQFEELADSRGVELIDGVVTEKPVGTESGSVMVRISYYLSAVVIPNRLGEVIGNDGRYRCFPTHPDRVRKPDVSLILRDRLPGGRVPIGTTLVRPDIAVEVVSPSDNYEDMDERVADYFDAEVPLIWVVTPKTRTVLVYHADGTARRLRDTDDLTADPIIPGFRVRIAELFPNPPELPPAPEPEAPPA